MAFDPSPNGTATAEPHRQRGRAPHPFQATKSLQQALIIAQALLIATVRTQPWPPSRQSNMAASLTSSPTRLCTPVGCVAAGCRASTRRLRPTLATGVTDTTCPSLRLRARTQVLTSTDLTPAAMERAWQEGTAYPRGTGTLQDMALRTCRSSPGPTCTPAAQVRGRWQAGSHYIQVCSARPAVGFGVGFEVELNIRFILSGMEAHLALAVMCSGYAHATMRASVNSLDIPYVPARATTPSTPTLYQRSSGDGEPMQHCAHAARVSALNTARGFDHSCAVADSPDLALADSCQVQALPAATSTTLPPRALATLPTTAPPAWAVALWAAHPTLVYRAPATRARAASLTS